MEKIKVLWISLSVMIALNLLLIGFVCVKHCNRHVLHNVHGKEQGCKQDRIKFSEKYGKDTCEKNGNPTERMKKELNLSENQVVKLNLLHENKTESMKEIKTIEQKLRDELVDLLKTNSKDDLKRDSLLNAIGVNKAEQSLHFFNYFSSIRELCTEGQKNKFDEMMLRMNRRMSAKH